jgi:hypothetical protein
MIVNTKHPVCTSQETHYVSATETNQLMLFGETVAVYCENHTEHKVNTEHRARGSVVVKALCYKPEGRGFDSR